MLMAVEVQAGPPSSLGIGGGVLFFHCYHRIGLEKRCKGSELGEAKCKNGEPCPPCGLARLSDLVLVTGQDEGGQKLGGSDDERDLLLSREEEDWKTFRTRRSGQMRRVWKQLKLLFLTDIFADKMWKTMGWDGSWRTHVFQPLQHCKQHVLGGARRGGEME